MNLFHPGWNPWRESPTRLVKGLENVPLGSS